MSSPTAISASVDSAISSVKQQIVLAQQASDHRQKSRVSGTEASSESSEIRPSIDSDQLQIQDLTEVAEVEAPNAEEMLDKVRNVIPKLNSVMHSMNLKLRFEEFADSGRYYVRAMDMVEKKEVSRLPHDQFLKQAEVTKHFINGLFVDHSK